MLGEFTEATFAIGPDYIDKLATANVLDFQEHNPDQFQLIVVVGAFAKSVWYISWQNTLDWQIMMGSKMGEK